MEKQIKIRADQLHYQESTLRQRDLQIRQLEKEIERQRFDD